MRSLSNAEYAANARMMMCELLHVDSVDMSDPEVCLWIAADVRRAAKKGSTEGLADDLLEMAAEYEEAAAGLERKA